MTSHSLRASKPPPTQGLVVLLDTGAVFIGTAGPSS